MIVSGYGKILQVPCRPDKTEHGIKMRENTEMNTVNVSEPFSGTFTVLLISNVLSLLFC